MAKHFQHFKTKQGYFSVWKEVFSYLETERFVPIIGDIKSRKKDWNRLVGSDESLSNFVRSSQMSSAKGDVSTWQMLLGVWVRLELTEPLWWWWTISHSNENLNSPRAKSPFMGCREKSTASGSRGRGVSNVRGKKVRAHSRVCLPLKMERLLPLHNISWLSCAFAIHWASLR